VRDGAWGEVRAVHSWPARRAAARHEDPQPPVAPRKAMVCLGGMVMRSFLVSAVQIVSVGYKP
jgi:hypothetical protein